MMYRATRTLRGVVDDVAVGRLVLRKALEKIAQELDAIEAADGAEVR